MLIVAGLSFEVGYGLLAKSFVDYDALTRHTVQFIEKSAPTFVVRFAN
jgi:hypothetical protein